MPQKPPQMVPAEKKHDITLPDERKGKVVGSIDVGEVRDHKGRTFRWDVPVLGGDAEDPRWDEMRKRKAMLTQMKGK